MSEPIKLPEFLFQHQKTAVTKCLKKGKFGLFYEMGTGKTFIMLGVLQNLNRIKQKALILCPKSLINLAWLEDSQKFEGLNICNLRKEQDPKADNYIINYESFKKYLPFIKTQPINVLIADESTKIKTANAQITKAVFNYRMKHKPKYRYILSGNPAPNGLLEIFTQLRLLSVKPFGCRFSSWRQKYFYQPTWDKFKWHITKKSEELIYNAIEPYCEFLSKDDTGLDFPDKIYQKREVEMTGETKKIYSDLEKDMVAQYEADTIRAVTPAVLSSKLRQCVSGFLYNENKEALRFGDDKYKELINVLESLKTGEQVVIWCSFRQDIEYLCRQLGKKYTTTYAYGGMNDSERDTNIKSFISGKNQLLVAHPACIGHGITIVNCRYAVYYSFDFNYETHQQSMDRIHRIGQARNVTYIYLMTGAIDKHCYKVLQRKAGVSDTMREYVNEIKGRLKRSF